MARPKKDKSAQGVYDRGGSWQVRIKRLDASKQIHRINRTFPYDINAPAASPHSREAVHKKAAAFAAAERAALHVEKRPTTALLETQTLGAWMQRYEDEICPRKKSGDGDRRTSRQLRARFPKLCARPAQSLLPQDFGSTSKHGVARVLDEQYFLAPSTIVRQLAVLSHVFSVAAKEWHFEVANPVLTARRPSVDNERDRVLTDKEWQAILKGLDGAHPATRGAIEFLRWTACRRSEAVKLRWENVRLDDRPVATFKDTKSPKTGKVQHRTIPLTKEVVKVLTALVPEDVPTPIGPVFAMGENRAVRPDSLTQAWSRACAKAKVADATLHDLRHTRTTELADLLPLQKVMRMTGHKTPKMLMRYYNPKAEDLGRDVEMAEAERDKQLKALAKKKTKKAC